MLTVRLAMSPVLDLEIIGRTVYVILARRV